MARRPPPAPCVRPLLLLSGGNPPTRLVVSLENAERTSCRVQLAELSLRYQPERTVQVQSEVARRRSWTLQGGEARSFSFPLTLPTKLPHCQAQLRGQATTQRLERGEPVAEIPLHGTVRCAPEIAR